MRKLFVVVAIGALFLAVAAPAMALDFKFGGEWRIRWSAAVNDGPTVYFGPTIGAAAGVPNGGTVASVTNAGIANNPNASGVFSRNPFQTVDGSNQRPVQIRIRPLITVSDDNGNIQAVWRGEIGDITFGSGGGAGQGGGNNTDINAATDFIGSSARVANGGGGGLGADGVNLETKWVYLDAALPFGIPLRARAGVQWWLLPKSLLVDEDMAGVRLYGETKPVSYEAFWYRPFESSTSRDDAYDFYGVRADVAIAPFLNPGIYYVYGRNAAITSINAAIIPAALAAEHPRDSHYIGVTATGKAGIFAYDFDFIYGAADGGATGAFWNRNAASPEFEKVKGWAADVGLHFPVGPITANFAFSYATGDKANGGSSEAFPTIAPSWNGPGGGFEMIGSGGAFDEVEFTQDGPTNLWAAGAWFTYTPVKPLVLKLAAAYAGFTSRNGNCALNTGNPCYGPAYAKVAGMTTLGTEVSLRADYTIWTGFKLQTQAGFLFPPAGSVAQEYVLQMLYNF